MNTFLSKISQLDAIRDVILLSLRGEPIFYRLAGRRTALDREVVLWNAIISDLGRPPVAELVYSKGRYYLHSTDVGFLIIGMSHDGSLKKIRVACANVQKKLVDPTVRKKVLLKMLSEGEEICKPYLINALMPLAGKDIETAAGVAIRQLQPMQPGRAAAAADRSAPGRPTAKEDNDQAGIVGNFLDDGNAEELQIKELLARKEKRQAIALIMQQITNHAKEKRFQKAEQLRDWLMQVDSMALVESIRAAEIIEEEKSASIGAEHLLIWKELVNILAPEEFASLYHATTGRSYADGEMVVKQGEFLPTLFFVNSGRVQIYAVSQGREVPLKVFEPGEIMGGETFFDASVWTVNAVSKGAFLSLLTWQRLQSQRDNCPALYSKLQDFCARFTSAGILFSKTSRTRRQLERKKLTGRVTIDLLDQHGNDMGLGGKGELLDLSKGGVAFSLRFSKKKNASALLAQKIRVNIRADASSAPLLRIGKVMAVRCHDFIGNDYSLHVEFEVELSNAEVQLVGKSR